MPAFVNLAKMTTATTGTGTITLGSAVSGFVTFGTAGLLDGAVVTYTIVDGTDKEVGRGTYTSSGTTLSRTLLLSTTGSLLSLSGSAVVEIVIGALDTNWAGGQGVYKPAAADFTLVQGTGVAGSATDTSRGVRLTSTGGTSSDKNSLLQQTLAAGDFTIDALMIFVGPWVSFMTFGLFIKDNSTGRIQAWGLGKVAGSTAANTSLVFRDLRWTTIDTFSTGVDVVGGITPSGPLWVRLTRVGTAMQAWISTDGEYYSQILNTTTDTVFVATPDRCGVWLGHNTQVSGVGAQIGLHLLSYRKY